MESISPELALDLLYQEADRIKMLIKNQQNHLCITQCKAFEEIVDTQMYGLSRQVSFSIRLGIISDETGQQLLSDLERDLNQLYNDIYEEIKVIENGKEV
ncbi:YlaN family protein [Tetragenococcus solitarius]|uniref:YlaN family protein n=1 Tax=Tetragenococcus solitarius TaxID=71453 RepID=A0ABP6KWR7_9ENTE|nr:YlaN family protein [Tetragenococcus solitarius]